MAQGKRRTTAPLLISYSDAARILGSATEETVARLVAEGELQAAGEEGSPRVTTASVLAYYARVRDSRRG